jgi:hypothetical protein
MDEANLTRTDPQGLSERVLTEILRTPALKELIILLMKDIDADTAPGLIKTVLWGEAGVSLSLFGAFPDMANWLLELLLELGRQLNGLPAPLLQDFLVQVGLGIDKARLKQFPEVYGRLAKRLLIGAEGNAGDAGALVASTLNAALAGADRLTTVLDDNREETARAIAGSLDELDTASAGKVLNRFLALGNEVRRARRVPPGTRLRSLLSEIEPGELFSALGGLLRNCAAAGWILIGGSLRSLKGKK